MELPGYEYVPVVAVQSVDRDRAVAAMDTLREAMDRYSGWSRPRRPGTSLWRGVRSRDVSPRARVDTDPAGGVYRFSDPHGRVIYVGKAKNLRSRLTSYFADLASLHRGPDGHHRGYKVE